MICFQILKCVWVAIRSCRIHIATVRITDGRGMFGMDLDSAPQGSKYITITFFGA